MSENTYGHDTSYESSPGNMQRDLSAAAAEFRSSVQEAMNRLGGAADNFISMSEGLIAAIDEARQAAERAQQAQHSIEEVQERMQRDYGAVSELVRDLQERIGALAILAGPMPGEPHVEPQSQSQDQGFSGAGEQQQEEHHYNQNNEMHSPSW